MIFLSVQTSLHLGNQISQEYSRSWQLWASDYKANQLAGFDKDILILKALFFNRGVE